MFKVRYKSKYRIVYQVLNVNADTRFLLYIPEEAPKKWVWVNCEDCEPFGILT